MIKLSKINKERVKPIPQEGGGYDPKKVKGYSLFQEPYANLFCLARKKSGKTTVIFNILKKCIDKHTRLVIFCSTVDKDASWKYIVKHFKKKGNEVNTFTSISEGKMNYLDAIVEELQEPEVEEEEKGPKINYIAFDDEEEDKPKRKRKPKKLSPEVVFIFDDLGNSIRSSSLASLLKKNRHFKSKVILSSQYLHDLQPESIRQLDYLLAFKGLSKEKLIKVHKGLDLAVDFTTFETIYENATKDKYCFLYIDAVNNEFRKCFDKKYSLSG